MVLMKFFHAWRYSSWIRLHLCHTGTHNLFIVRSSKSPLLSGCMFLYLLVSRVLFLYWFNLVPSYMYYNQACGCLQDTDTPMSHLHHRDGNPNLHVSTCPCVVLTPLSYKENQIYFRIALVSIPSRPSTEQTKGDKLRRFWRHSSVYLSFYLYL